MTIQGSAAPKLSVRGATKVYGTAAGKLVAIDNCSLDVRPGEIVSVLGPSGCGKTTLLWSMSGLHALTAGTVLLDGKAIREPSREIGMVFQEANAVSLAQSRRQHPLSVRDQGQRPDRAWIDELLNRVGLEGFGDRFPRELSGGMQQRAALVRALSFKPSVLLMDEPFGALDSFTREEMNRLVEEIWLETRTTIVLITHSIEEAIFLSDRVVVMSARPRPRRQRISRCPSRGRARSRSWRRKEVFDLTNAIKLEIVGEAPAPSRRSGAAIAAREVDVSRPRRHPRIQGAAGEGTEVGIANLSALAGGPGIRSTAEVAGDHPGGGGHHRRRPDPAAGCSRCRNTFCRSRARSALR